MKVLVIGKNGQLGWELKQTCPDHIDLYVCDYPKIDLASLSSIQDCINKTEPDCIINAAAYTAVDQAEEERETAFRINSRAVEYISKIAHDFHILLVHISTDFVFDGENYKPYLPKDSPNPVSVYGQSKLEGELAVLKNAPGRSLIIRTAWLYSSHGNNFVKSMLGLMQTKSVLRIIDEQVGTPTWANGLAQCVWLCIEKDLKGIHHWTDAGVASWYDFAVAVYEEARALGIISKPVEILPIPSDQYPTLAKRPFYSVLDKRSIWEATGIKSVHWRVQLRQMLEDMIGG